MGGLYREFGGFLLANQILHVVFIFLPILWLLGVLPPLTALFLWIGEQGLVILFGGSPMASDIRYTWVASCEKVPHALSRCHTKRRTGARAAPALLLV